MDAAIVMGFDIERASAAFYDSLFEQFPQIRRLFGDLGSQRRMFEVALKSVLYKSNNKAELERYLRLLGEKHKMLGILPLHMEQGMYSFIQALRAGNPDIDEETMARMVEIYNRLVEVMGYNCKVPIMV